MKTDNLTYEQLVALRFILSAASDHAMAMVAHWHEQSDKPVRIGGEEEAREALYQLQGWSKKEQEWWQVESDIDARIRILKAEEAA